LKKKNKYIEFLKNLFLLISSLALIFGGLWSRAYSKDKEDKEKNGEDLKKITLENVEFLNKFILLSSPLALIGGGLVFLLYSILVVKDFPRSIEVHLFYYIFAIFVYFIISIIAPLAILLYTKITEESKKIRKMLIK
jgi:hypothetical protein